VRQTAEVFDDGPPDGGVGADAKGVASSAPAAGLEEERRRFAELYDRHREALYRFCLLRTGNPWRAEDIVQDVFEKAFVVRGRFDGRRPFWSWLATIAARECIDDYRRSRRRERRVADLARRTSSRESADTTVDRVMQHLDRDLLEAEMARLPYRQRVALQLYAMDGWTYAEIANQLGYSVAGVRGLIVRARTRLREVAAGSIAGVLGGLDALRARLRRVAARARLLPSAAGSGPDVVGSWMASVSTHAPALMAALAVVAAGVAVPGSSPVSVRSVGGRAPIEQAVATGAPAPPPAVGGHPSGGATDRVPVPEPAVRPPMAAVERAINETAAPVLAPAGAPADPATMAVADMAASPGHDGDETVFVASQSVPGPQLLVSHDGAGTWNERRALGLGPVVRLLFPPSYPRDPRVFALTAKGLQVTRDDGDTFETLAPVPGATDAAFSPQIGRAHV
jgi:RNA polymerase sigma-70 factor (ECF subfamily)